MKKTETIIINFTGGIISPGHLFEVLSVAELSQVKEVKFGQRQQLIIDVPVKHYKTFADTCKKNKIAYSLLKDATPNITSSYPAADIFINDTWLSEGIYKDVFNMLDATHKLKVSICDYNQTFIPFFTSNINWIATTQRHYWFLYIRFPRTNTLFCWPEEIYTNDIGAVTKAVEKILLDETYSMISETADGQKLFNLVNKQTSYIGRNVQKDLQLPSFHLPYYEGFNRQGNYYWLGIYKRDEEFSVPFLKDLCTICTETKVGQFYATPWKSVIIKNIDAAHRGLWDYVLGKYRINVRHAANELNWIVEDNSEDALILKRHIIRYFDKEDVRTYGLCFSIKVKTRTGLFGSVVIRKCDIKNTSRLKSLERYDILYTKDFNPNSGELVLFRENVEKDHLGVYLVSLSKIYYERTSAVNVLQSHQSAPLPQPTAPVEQKVHQCCKCMTIYDPATGDEAQGIAAGTAFGDLPDTYCCPLCEEPLSGFNELSLSMKHVER
jgi:rubredoxin